MSLVERIQLELGGQEPWPKDVRLFQPYEVEQILLPDNANCLSVQTYLKMCDLPYKVDCRANAEAMSPSGRVPFLKCGAFLVAELEPIVQFIHQKGISLSDRLTPDEQADMRAYMSLINNVLANAELYLSWCDKETYDEITYPRYGSVYPFPLNIYLTYLKKKQIKNKLDVAGWLNKTLEEVYEEVDNCCQALAERLRVNEMKDERKMHMEGDFPTQFFFGKLPTELDALVFGHLFTILTTPLPNSNLANVIRKYPSLVDLVKTLETMYFTRQEKK